MALTSALAIYVLFWTLTLFVILPFGMRTAEEAGAKPLPGHAESAPHDFRFARVLLRTTIVAAIAFGLFYANYVNGWIGPDLFDWIRPNS